MKSFTLRIDPLTGEEYCEVYLRGRQLLADPNLNKGSAYSEEERNALNLQGLVRQEQTLAMQVQRCEAAYEAKATNLERYIYLNSLQDRNETLFYKLLTTHLAEMMPVVYTPTVGEACLNLSRIQRRYRGLYVTPDNVGHIDKVLHNAGRDDEVRLIVVTDGERILGLGDLGSDGMGIPIGKIALYVAAAGLHPVTTLPVCLDVGTNNPRLLEDPLYLGVRRPRLRGEEYERFIERFVVGVRRSYPNCLLQWEDFAKPNAFPLLKRYRDRMLSFNDDIQGTGAVALATLMNATKLRGTTFSDERFLVCGMGSAGVGVAWNIRNAMRAEGLSDEEIRERIFALDMPGLLLQDMSIEEAQKPFAQPRARVAGWKLEQPDRIGVADIVRNGKVTVLVGLSATGGLFDQNVLGALAKNTPRPVVMALSNPTSKSECGPLDVVRATDGRGIMACGSPFPQAEWGGRAFPVSQCNNLYIFPGVGLGALIARATKVTDQMFLAASRALAALVSDERRESGLLLPDLRDVRAVSAKVALAVAKEARDSGLGRLEDDEALGRRIARAQWDPHYYPYRAGRVAVASEDVY